MPWGRATVRLLASLKKGFVREGFRRVGEPQIWVSCMAWVACMLRHGSYSQNNADYDLAVYPDMGSREMEVGVDYINRCVGTSLDAPAIAQLLSRMALDAGVAPGGEAVRVRVPPTRSDVLHACDVMEVWVQLARQVSG